MWFGLRNKRAAGASGRKRKANRFSTDLLTCSLGAIVDLSGGGIRLRGEGKPGVTKGQVLPVTLQSPQSRLTMRGRVSWVKVRGIRSKQFEVGIEFTDVRPELVEALKCLARFGFVPRMKAPAAAAGATAAAAAATSDSSLAPRGEPFVDYYAVLGLTASATTKEIQEAYRALARLHHPDHDKSPGAATRFDAIAKAHRVLRDTESRDAFDAVRAARV